MYDKQIEYLNEEIDLLNEQSEAIDEQIAALNEYYDKLIEDTERMYDEMLEGLNATLEKWQQLAEIDTIAKAWKDVGGVMEMLGYSVEDVLNDAPGAFDAFKDAYVAVLSDMNKGNSDYLAGLQEWSNQTGIALGDLGTKAFDAGKSIDEGIAEALMNAGLGPEEAAKYGDEVIKYLKELGFDANSPSKKAKEAAESIPEGVVKAFEEDDTAENAAESFGQRIIDKLKETLETKLGESNLDLTKLFPENFDLTNVVNQFALLADAIRKVSDALGIGEEGATNGIAQAIADIGAMTLGAIATEDAAGEGIIGQFGALKDAVQAVTQAIGAVEEEGAESAGEGEATGTLISAIQALKDAADTYIGVGGGEEEGGGEESEEGSDTVIGDFEALKQAITENINTIGNEESEESDGTLIGNMMYLPTVAEETIPEVIGLFEELLAMIQECASQCASLAEEISGLAGTSISIGGHSSGASTPIPSKRYQGTAHAQGSWGLQRGETALVGELGRELVVTKNGNYYTVGDKGAEFAKLNKGDIVFNHLKKVALYGNVHRIIYLIAGNSLEVI